MAKFSPMDQKNRQRIEQILDDLRVNLAPVAVDKLKSQYGSLWWDQGVSPRLNIAQKNTLGLLNTAEQKFAADLQIVLQVFVWNWIEVFRNTLAPQVRGYIFELIDFRNRWAHFYRFSSDDCDRADTTAQLLYKLLNVTPQNLPKDDDSKKDNSSRVFELTLHDAYYKNGFFNVPVSFERYVRPDNGPVNLVLGRSGQTVQGRVDRSANKNGTPRILGRARLRDWFQSNFEPKASVDVDLSSQTSIRLE